MSDITEITEKLIQFRDERNWEQFHNSKDLAIAISIEANELLELFLWKQPEEADQKKVKEELQDKSLRLEKSTAIRPILRLRFLQQQDQPFLPH